MPRSMLHGKRKRLPWEKLEIGIIRILERIFHFSFDFLFVGVGWLERTQFLSGLFCWCFFLFNLDFLLVLFCWWVDDILLFFFSQWLDLLLVSFLQDVFFLKSICSFFFPGWSPPAGKSRWLVFRFDSRIFDSASWRIRWDSIGCCVFGWSGFGCPLWVALGLGGWDGGNWDKWDSL